MGKRTIWIPDSAKTSLEKWEEWFPKYQRVTPHDFHFNHVVEYQDGSPLVTHVHVERGIADERQRFPNFSRG